MDKSKWDPKDEPGRGVNLENDAEQASENETERVDLETKKEYLLEKMSGVEHFREAHMKGC